MSAVRDHFKQGMRRLASGVCVIAARTPQNRRCGITATAVSSLTAEPPSLLVCINKSTWLGAEIERAGAFSVNLLSHAQKDVGMAFSGISGHAGEDRFTVGEWSAGITGAPVLVDAAAAFECAVDHVVDRGTHFVVIGLVRSVVNSPEADTALIYADGDFGVCAPIDA
jgi:flavin reductase (DIM6/NTAB) family NADH-FMN oxidoreductase RutF